MAAAFPQATVELWATDEHRIGLKPLVRRVWTLPGHRPLALVEPRYQWRYLVAFVHLTSGRTVWHLATGVSTELFAAELAACAEAVGAGPEKEMLLLLDGRVGTPAPTCVCWSISICLCCRPIRPNYRPASISGNSPLPRCRIAASRTVKNSRRGN